MKRFSLVIPCFNEASSLDQLLARCQPLLRNDSFELILVDNGSTDDTPKLLDTLLPIYPECRCVRVDKNMGYGHGIMAGLNVAQGDIVGWTHADLQTDPEDVLRGLSLFDIHGPKIFVKGTRIRRPIADQFFTVGMSIFESLLLGVYMRDINAQPTMFPRSFLKSIKNPPLDFSLDLYFYYQAKKNRIPVHRIPVRFSERLHGNSHWNIGGFSKIKFILRTLRYSLKLRKTL